MLVPLLTEYQFSSLSLESPLLPEVPPVLSSQMARFFNWRAERRGQPTSSEMLSETAVLLLTESQYNLLSPELLSHLGDRPELSSPMVRLFNWKAEERGLWTNTVILLVTVVPSLTDKGSSSQSQESKFSSEDPPDSCYPTANCINSTRDPRTNTEMLLVMLVPLLTEYQFSSLSLESPLLPEVPPALSSQMARFFNWKAERRGQPTSSEMLLERAVPSLMECPFNLQREESPSLPEDHPGLFSPMVNFTKLKPKYKWKWCYG